MADIVKVISLDNIERPSDLNNSPKDSAKPNNSKTISGNVIIKKSRSISVPSQRILEVVERQQRRLRKCFSRA